MRSVKPLKRFRSFIKEETIQTYIVQVNPYTTEEDIAQSLTEIIAMSLWHSSKGIAVTVAVRPEPESVS